MQKGRQRGIIVLVIFLVIMYVVRHCEAQGNLSHRFQGKINHDITDMGAMQLELLAKRFDAIHIDAAYASPLIRAHKTAAVVAERKGLSVTDVKGLMELNVGALENVLYEDFKTAYADLYDKWVNAPHEFCAPNGEKMVELYERIWQAVEDIAKENEGKTVLVASHGCAIRNLLARVLNDDIKTLKDIKIPFNTGVTKLIFDGGRVEVEYVGDCSHLPSNLQSEGQPK